MADTKGYFTCLFFTFLADTKGYFTFFFSLCWQILRGILHFFSLCWQIIRGNLHYFITFLADNNAQFAFLYHFGGR